MGLLNLGCAVVFYPQWVAIFNAAMAGFLLQYALSEFQHASLHRAKDRLIEVLEHNQDECMRFLDLLNEAGKHGRPFEVSTECVDDPNKPKQMH